jgi:hypothetical protein
LQTLPHPRTGGHLDGGVDFILSFSFRAMNRQSSSRTLVATEATMRKPAAWL